MVMRRISKKNLGKEEAKRGSMLVTILFIVAIAIIFVSTALMISVASRSRVYTNAIDDQTRLTLYSLSQTVWQAIYSQEITDDQLVQLALNKATITFTGDAAPGLGQGGSTAKAYFWTPSTTANDVSVGTYTYKRVDNIYIEFEIQIDGVYEYYTMALKYHNSVPKAGGGFDFCVELNGHTSDLNSLVVGYIGDNKDDRTDHLAFEAADNITFIHNAKQNSVDGFGWYTTLVADGVVQMRDSVFARDVIFIGENAGLDIGGGQMLGQTKGNFYFYGTMTPFSANGTQVNSTTFSFYGNNYIFDRNNATNVGFENYGMEWISQNLRDITGTLYYENGIRINGTVGRPTENFTGDMTPSNYRAYANQVDPLRVDTIAEAAENHGFQTDFRLLDHLSDHPATCTEDHGTTDTFTPIALATTTSLGAGNYYVTDSNLNHNIAIDISSGSVYLYLSNGLNFSCPDDSNAFITVNGGSASNDNNLYIILKSGTAVTFNNERSHYIGIVDTGCYSQHPRRSPDSEMREMTSTLDPSGDNYNDPRYLDQTRTPHIYLFSAGKGTAEYQLNFIGNGRETFTGYVGFYPSTQGGTDDAGVSYNGPNGSQRVLFYGRLSVSALKKLSGSYLYMPYCPAPPTGLSDTNTPSRDGTDYSVVSDGCGFYSYRETTTTT